MSAVDNLIAASSGSAGAAFTIVLLFPLDVLKTHMNRGKDAHGVKYSGLSDVIRRILRDYGVQGFYKGLSTRTVHQIFQKFIYYYLYDGLRSIYKSIMEVRTVAFGPNLVTGYVSGVLTVLSVNPLEVASTRQQLGQSSGETSTIAVMRRMARDEGVGVFYRGCLPNVILSINPAIENTLFDQIRVRYMRRFRVKGLSMMEAFWLGAAAKYVATLLTFPYIRAKVIMQAGESKNGNKDAAAQRTPPTTLGVLARICRDDGPVAMWAGMAPQAVKAVLTSAVLMAAKTKIEVVVRKLILALVRRKR